MVFFLQFKSEFGNKEFMICFTVSSQSCFCWLYSVSPSSAAKNIISLISVDHLVMPMCRVISCFVERGCLLWPVSFLGKALSAFACFILYSKAKLACYSGYFLTSYFHILVPYDEKNIFGSFQLQLLQPFNFSFFSISAWGTELDYCNIEWFA